MRLPDGRAPRGSAWMILVIWALVFLGHAWEAEPKMDAMTYGVLARNVLETGDWKTLHYTSSAYPSFYNHPPLGIWMQAAAFALFGDGNLALKILPALLGLGTAAGLVAWGVVAGSAWVGIAASFILLTTPRYVKYASDFLLDGPLAFFLVWGVVLFLLAERAEGRGARFWAFALGSGAAGALAFLTKGPLAAVVPLVWLARLAAARGARARVLGAIGVAAAGAAVPLALWLGFGGGAEYLDRYWAESVAGRLAPAAGVSQWRRLAPLSNLARTYWPWLPLFVAGLFTVGVFSGPRRWLRHPVGPAAVAGLAVLGAFLATGQFLEHYLVPFYPFAALVAAAPLARVPLFFRERTAVWAGRLTVAAAVVLAIFPVPLHANRNAELHRFLGSLPEACGEGVREIALSEELGDRWYLLAAALWYTRWEALTLPPGTAPGASHARLLVLPAGAPAPRGWERAFPGVSPASGYSLLRPAASSLCKPLG